jgi:hypothetical protein
MFEVGALIIFPGLYGLLSSYKEDTIGRTCNMHGEDEICMQVVVGKPEG